MNSAYSRMRSKKHKGIDIRQLGILKKQSTRIMIEDQIL